MPCLLRPITGVDQLLDHSILDPVPLKGGQPAARIKGAGGDLVAGIGEERHAVPKQFFSELVSAALFREKASPFVSAPGIEVADHHAEQITRGGGLKDDGVFA